MGVRFILLVTTKVANVFGFTCGGRRIFGGGVSDFEEANKNPGRGPVGALSGWLLLNYGSWLQPVPQMMEATRAFRFRLGFRVAGEEFAAVFNELA